MGAVQSVCNQAMKVTNSMVPAGDNFTRHVEEGTRHMLICALDYKKTQNPLTCTMDGKNMERLARACGIEDLTCMYDEQCSISSVKQALEDIAGRMSEDGIFIFYYSGHGVNVQDYSGDEEDGEDEAFCFVDEYGQVSQDTLMTDDDFAEVLTGALPPQARVLIMTDCCHSGTIADLEKAEWNPFEVVSLAGCLDSQTSGDMGRGGIFTHSMLLAIERLQRESKDEYSAGLCYNTTVSFDDKVFASAQDITMQTNASITPDRFAWPLVPQEKYLSPLTKANKKSASTAGPAITYGAPGEDDDDDDAQGDISALAPQALADVGVNPSLASMLQENPADAIQDIDVEDMLSAASKWF
eukprot:TRINITY_DN54348_c0_g1_i1.p1 TRINITY_DN54348_c0_g1~~TRINITY_DN54348_c0_g1_i1.p1  ORF type:complete len:355 (+),score=117.04 TRINITY_DN54348_c0_g1_i1:68-1132(+)